jgi:hypothetical protein
MRKADGAVVTTRELLCSRCQHSAPAGRLGSIRPSVRSQLAMRKLTPLVAALSVVVISTTDADARHRHHRGPDYYAAPGENGADFRQAGVMVGHAPGWPPWSRGTGTRHPVIPTCMATASYLPLGTRGYGFMLFRPTKMALISIGRRSPSWTART